MGNDRVESLLVVRSLCTNEKLLYNNCTVQIVSFFFRVLTTPHNAHIKTMGSEHCTVISFLHHAAVEVISLFSSIHSRRGRQSYRTLASTVCFMNVPSRHCEMYDRANGQMSRRYALSIME